MSITWEDVLERRERRYARRPELRLLDEPAARAFVQRVGFCHFWPIQRVELPNLFHAIAGRVRPVPMEHDDPDISLCWGWKDAALGQRWWYYGKLIRRRSTLVSLTLLPAFHACSENLGDFEADYLTEYRAGTLSVEAKAIYEALLEHGPLHTIELRKHAHLTQAGAKARFERSLTELQTGLKVLPMGLAEAGAWRYVFMYDIVQRHFPDLAEQARALSRRQAMRRLAACLLENLVAAPRREVCRTLDVLKGTPAEWEHVMAGLLQDGEWIECPLDGENTPLLLSCRALE